MHKRYAICLTIGLLLPFGCSVAPLPRSPACQAVFETVREAERVFYEAAEDSAHQQAFYATVQALSPEPCAGHPIRGYLDVVKSNTLIAIDQYEQMLAINDSLIKALPPPRRRRDTGRLLRHRAYGLGRTGQIDSSIQVYALAIPYHRALPPIEGYYLSVYGAEVHLQRGLPADLDGAKQALDEALDFLEELRPADDDENSYRNHLWSQVYEQLAGLLLLQAAHRFPTRPRGQVASASVITLPDVHFKALEVPYHLWSIIWTALLCYGLLLLGMASRIFRQRRKDLPYTARVGKKRFFDFPGE